MTLSKYRKRRHDKYQRRAARLALMRAAKARKRLLNPPPDPEPKMERWCRFEIGVRDKLAGPVSYGVAWTDLWSVRDAARRLAVILKYCQ